MTGPHKFLVGERVQQRCAPFDQGIVIERGTFQVLVRWSRGGQYWACKSMVEPWLASA